MTKRDLVLELHKPARKVFPRRQTVMRNISDLYQADLVEMIPYAKENNEYKYILTCINCLSKVAFCAPLKSKTSAEVAKQMEKYVLKTLPKYLLPKHMQTDAGKEFWAKPFRDLMLRYHIKHYSTYSSIKAAIVERFNRTLKRKMWIEFSVRGSHKWIDILDKLTEDYNSSYHRAIGMKPIEVNTKNQYKVLLRLNKPKQLAPKKARFHVGQLVRISKEKHIFEKGYNVNWSYEVFKIVKVSATQPRVYHLEDLKGQPISGGFYEQELSEAKFHDIYLVEKVLKRKGDKVLVKYLGFDNSDNQWIPASALT